MSAQRRIPLASVVITAAAAAAVSPVLFTTLRAPEPAERTAPAPAASAPPVAGVVDELTLVGPARLLTPSDLSAGARVMVRSPARGTITLSVAGRTCTSAAELPAGRGTLSVRCTLTPEPDQIHGLSGSVTVVLERSEAGRPLRATRTAQRSLAVDDGAPLSSTDAKERWTTLATVLRDRADGLRQPEGGSAAAASAVWREAQRSGWSSAATRARVRALTATAKPGGGYGLDAAWDAYDDGTANPASTAYTLTTTGHVGWVLLEAYTHHALPQADLHATIDAVLAMPRLNGGTCIAYSDAPNDADQGCVYHVTHGAAAFLTQARALTGHRSADIDALLRLLRTTLTEGYDPATGYWAGMTGQSAPQDMARQVSTARSVDVVDPGFGAVSRMMTLPWWRHPGAAAQTPASVAAAMLAVAKDCRYTRSPAVLLAAEGARGSGATAFEVQSMSAVADVIERECFSGEGG